MVIEFYHKQNVYCYFRQFHHRKYEVLVLRHHPLALVMFFWRTLQMHDSL